MRDIAVKSIRALGSLLVLLSATSAVAVEFYVATDGNDANPGTRRRPFATVARARGAVREAKDKARGPSNVFLRGGTYFLQQPVQFGPEDSGTKDRPITYASYSGEKAVLSGGRVIAGWKQASEGVWTAEIPAVKQGKWHFGQLFVGGQRRPRARLPRQGYYQVAAAGNPPTRAFKFHPGELNPKWHNLDDVEIVLLQFWTDARLRIESIDRAANTVRFTGDTWRPTSWSNGWYVENVFEGLTRPGDWYLDRQAGLLYYRPLPGEKVEQLEFVAPVTKQWIHLEGDYKTGKLVEYLTFRGLSFQYSDGDLEKSQDYSYPQATIESPQYPQAQAVLPAGVFARGARHIRFEGNEIAQAGAWGIHLAQGGCKDNHIVGNTMRDLGAGAIRIGGPEPTSDRAEESGRTTITDNRIDGCAKVYLGAPAIIVLQSGGNRVAHNEITGGCQWAVSVGWTWNYLPPGDARDNIVEYNHCHHIGDSVLGTHGVLYLLGIQPGTVVRHNLIHDITGNGSGIVLDNSATGIVVEHNVVHHVAYDGLLFNFNDLGNIVQNNIVAMAGNSLVNRSGDEGKLDQTGVFYRNIFYRDGDKCRIFVPDKWANYDIVLDYNLYFDASVKPPKFLGLGFEQWKQKGLDRNSIVANPLFADPQKGDFRLDPRSPAFRLGFRPIDLSRVGIRPPEQRSADD
jgi:hypothetical protein